MKKILSCVIACVVSACSLTGPESVAVDPEVLSSVRYSLYLSRASLMTTEFEQYKLLSTGLFVECGTIQRGRAEVREQRIERLSGETLASSQAAAYAIYQRLSSAEPPHVDQPGTNASLIDPGKFTLGVQVGADSKALQTSLDFVERREGSIATQANDFAEIVRGITASPPCGNGEFYGLGRTSK